MLGHAAAFGQAAGRYFASRPSGLSTPPSRNQARRRRRRPGFSAGPAALRDPRGVGPKWAGSCQPLIEGPRLPPGLRGVAWAEGTRGGTRLRWRVSRARPGAGPQGRPCRPDRRGRARRAARSILPSHREAGSRDRSRESCGVGFVMTFPLGYGELGEHCNEMRLEASDPRERAGFHPRDALGVGKDTSGVEVENVGIAKEVTKFSQL